MNIETLALIKKSIDFAKVGIEYIVKDQTVMLGMRVPQFAEFAGKGIGRGNFDDGIFKIISEVGGDTVRLESKPFTAPSGRWNGPDGIDNTIKDGRLEGSFWHDPIWGNKSEIAKAWGCTEEEVMHWANGLFNSAWRGYGKMYPKAKYVKAKARLAYSSVEFSVPWYHKIKKIFGFAVIIISLCTTGCSCSVFKAPPDITMTSSSGIFGDESVESIEPWISTNVVGGVR